MRMMVRRTGVWTKTDNVGTSHDSHPEDVLHGIAAGRATLQPASGNERAVGEQGAVLGMVYEFEPLARAQKVHTMLTRDRTAPQRMDADLARRPLACLAAAPVAPHVTELNAATTRDSRRQRQRRAARRIDLSGMMRLDDLGVARVRAEHACGLLDQPKQQVHTDTEIRCREDRTLEREPVEQLQCLVL